MNRIFHGIGNLIEKHPFKVLLVTLLIFAILIATGVPSMEMATGNETLVKTDNPAFISNKEMEDTFGGDSILVLFTDESGKKVLSLDNLQKMWNIEQKFQYEDNLFSFMSPASIVHQMTEAQSGKIKENALIISDGLDEMGNKLTEIGTELKNKELPDPKAVEEKLDNLMSRMNPESMMKQIGNQQGTEIQSKLLTMADGLGEMGEKLIDIGRELGSKDVPDPKAVEKKLSDFSEMTNVFNKLMGGQDNLGEGAGQLKGNLVNAADGLENISSQLNQMANQMGDNPQMQGQLTIISKKIKESSQGLSTMSEKTGMITEGSQNTSKTLDHMSSQLKQQIDEMKKGLSGGISPEELKTMSGGFVTMGENLTELSKGLSTMSEGNELLPDGFAVLSDLGPQLEKEMAEMKKGLSGGISPEELRNMSDGFVTMGGKLKEIGEGLHTFHDKSGMMVPNFPHNQKELDTILYEEDGVLRSMFSDVVIDDQNSLMVIKLQGNIGDEAKTQLAEDISNALDKEEFENVSYVVSGKPVLDSALKSEMRSNMVKMIGLAVIIMLIVLAIVFKVRWRMLSLLVILISVIATLGLMSILNVPITMVSMAVFPILIGLGIDYSIQFHNRYEEELSVQRTVGQMGTAVAIAVLATVLGFISLYASPVPMIQDFGNMLTIGVIIAFIGSIFILTPILHLRDNMAKSERSAKSGKTQSPYKESMLDRLLQSTTKLVLKLSIPILIAVIGLAALGFVVDGNVGVETDIESFMPQDMAALKDIHQIRDKKGSTDQIAIYMKDDNILAKENLQWMQSKTKDLEEKYKNIVVDAKSIDALVGNLSSEEDLTTEEYMDIIDSLPEQQRGMFISEDGTQSVILLNIEHLAIGDLQDFVTNLKEEVKDAPMEVEVTGKSVLDVEMVKGLTSGRIQMTLIGLGLVFVALLILYRNLFKALIPIFPVVLIVGMSSGIMYLLGIKFTPITSTLGALVLGMGTEMTVMLLERYIEERKTGKDKLESMMVATTMIGKAIVASGLTTVGGFSVLMASEFIILKDFGLMTVINITLALLSTFIVLPPTITLFDGFLFSKKEKREVEGLSH
ncbi:hydrophobe/amphiphile efflux-3 (HAE3) family transporter [Irregularibacter muris]|nr:hydrophobe/amphiphile efflux-3 (HAE3) family transporter [Irregularibacter muris]